MPASNLKKAIAKILPDEGYIKSYEVVEDGTQCHPYPAEVLKKGLSGLRRNYFHVQGRHDRQGSACEPCRRRSPGIRMVRRVLNNV